MHLYLLLGGSVLLMRHRETDEEDPIVTVMRRNMVAGREAKAFLSNEEDTLSPYFKRADEEGLERNCSLPLITDAKTTAHELSGLPVHGHRRALSDFTAQQFKDSSSQSEITRLPNSKLKGQQSLSLNKSTFSQSIAEEDERETTGRY